MTTNCRCSNDCHLCLCSLRERGFTAFGEMNPEYVSSLQLYQVITDDGQLFEASLCQQDNQQIVWIDKETKQPLEVSPDSLLVWKSI